MRAHEPTATSERQTSERQTSARKWAHLTTWPMLVAAILSLMPGYQMGIAVRIVAALGIAAGLVFVWTSRALTSVGPLRRTAAIGGWVMMLLGGGSLVPGTQQVAVGLTAAIADGGFALLLIGLLWESSRRKD